MTTAQALRTCKMFEEFAKMPVTVEKIGDTIYAFGEELAVLRIFAKYNNNGSIHNPNARIGIDKQSGSHYFALDSNV